jgi:hypothetical protein
MPSWRDASMGRVLTIAARAPLWLVFYYIGEIIMGKKYHIVIAQCTIYPHKWEMLFGDYDKNVAKDEREDLADSSDGCDYEKFKVVTLPEDSQAAIDSYIAVLNQGKTTLKPFKAGATVAFSLMPVGSKFSWIGNQAINIKTSPFSAESMNGMYKWSAIDKHFTVNDLVTFWE